MLDKKTVQATKRLLEAMEPVIKPILLMAENDPITKDGYGVMLYTASQFDEGSQRNFFLAAAVHFGFPYMTAFRIAGIMNDEAGFLAAISILNDSLLDI